MQKDGLGRTALVTGASAGIGRAFAEVLAARGYRLVLVARRADRLEAAAAELRQRHGIETSVITADLAEPEAPARLAAELERRGLAVDVLVNNAGYGVPGRYEQSPWARHDANLRVMVTAVCELTYRLLPGMIERKWGRIINIASLAGHLPAPAGHTLYAATKAFLVRFSESLHAEHVARRHPHLRRLSRVHLQRVPRRDRHPRQGEPDAGGVVDGRADGGRAGLCRGHARRRRCTSTAASTAASPGSPA